MKIKCFVDYYGNKVLLNPDRIISAHETLCGGRCCTVVIMEQGETYTLSAALTEFKNEIEQEG